MDFQPLCPQLYDALAAWAGELPLVANSGEGIVTRTIAGREEVIEPGETYRVNCRYCGDTRHRLYVNHTWYQNRYLAHCFNEKECLKDPQTRIIFDGELKTRIRVDKVAVLAAPPAPPDDPTVSVEPPGSVRPLDRVSPDHPAVRYALSRGFDPIYLARVFAVGVCDAVNDPRHWPMVGRLYIPVFDGWRMAGWQGRAPFDPPRNPVTGKPDWKATGQTKYYNRPRFRKSRYLYGPYVEPDLPYVILVEGVTDVWRVGPAARAYLGIELSQYQRARVFQRWSGGVVVCMGDGGAQANNEHQAGLLEHELQHHGGRVVKVTLPGDCDPGGLTYDQNWTHIEAATAAAGCPIRRPA